MTIAVGIDPSLTGTAVCCIGPMSLHSWTRFSSDPATGVRGRINRYACLCNAVLHKVTEGHGLGGPKGNPSVIAIEGYSFASKGGLQLDRIEYGGILRWTLAAAFKDARIIEVPPTILKLFTTGSGAATKEAMAVNVFKRWKVEFKTNDETDAFALAMLAACIAGFDQPANDAQKRAIDSVLHGKRKKPKKPQPAE